MRICCFSWSYILNIFRFWTVSQTKTMTVKKTTTDELKMKIIISCSSTHTYSKLSKNEWVVWICDTVLLSTAAIWHQGKGIALIPSEAQPQSHATLAEYNHCFHWLIPVASTLPFFRFAWSYCQQNSTFPTNSSQVSCPFELLEGF